MANKSTQRQWKTRVVIPSAPSSAPSTLRSATSAVPGQHFCSDTQNYRDADFSGLKNRISTEADVGLRDFRVNN